MAHPEAAYNIRLPASSANLGPGFDTLGLALSLYLDISVGFSDTFSVTTMQEDGREVADDPDTNLIVRALRHAWSHTGFDERPVAIRSTNEIPLGRGLGSSAAACVAGVAAGLLLAKGKAPPDLVLNLSAEMEGHADNVAPAIYGGLTIVRRAGI